GRRPVFAILLVYDFQSQESCGLRHNTRKTQGFSTKNCDIQRRGFLTLNNHATYTRTVVNWSIREPWLSRRWLGEGLSLRTRYEFVQWPRRVHSSRGFPARISNDILHQPLGSISRVS